MTCGRCQTSKSSMSQDLALMMHAAHQHRRRVFRLGHPRWICPRRWLVQHRRSFLNASCGCCWLYSSRKLSKARCCARRWAAAGCAVFCFSVRWHALVPTVLFRMSGLNSLRHDAQFHPPHRQPRQSAHRREANGAPLSMRIAASIPYSRNAASKIARIRTVSVFSTAWQRSRYWL